MHKYFPDGNCNTSYDEFIEYMKGFNEPVDDHMGATFEGELSGRVTSFFKRPREGSFFLILGGNLYHSPGDSVLIRLKRGKNRS
jgi:hypothetical protein